LTKCSYLPIDCTIVPRISCCSAHSGVGDDMSPPALEPLLPVALLIPLPLPAGLHSGRSSGSNNSNSTSGRMGLQVLLYAFWAMRQHWSPPVVANRFPTGLVPPSVFLPLQQRCGARQRNCYTAALRFPVGEHARIRLVAGRRPCVSRWETQRQIAGGPRISEDEVTGSKQYAPASKASGCSMSIIVPQAVAAWPGICQQAELSGKH
jgi:hypothetical protein